MFNAEKDEPSIDKIRHLGVGCAILGETYAIYVKDTPPSYKVWHSSVHSHTPKYWCVADALLKHECAINDHDEPLAVLMHHTYSWWDMMPLNVPLRFWCTLGCLILSKDSKKLMSFNMDALNGIMCHFVCRFFIMMCHGDQGGCPKMDLDRNQDHFVFNFR